MSILCYELIANIIFYSETKAEGGEGGSAVIYTQKAFYIETVYPHSTFISLRAKKDFPLILLREKSPPQPKILYVKSNLTVNYKLLIIRLYINGSMVIVLAIISYLWFQLYFAQCNISSGVSHVINQVVV